jgi:exopolyphosphatase / guanosine-5'-triphosphate,3'-diphosphate pyrophosphatase
MKIAAIDIGSNAARLLIVDVVVNKQRMAEFDKVDFVRLPLRLGFDVFENGKIGQLKMEKVVTAMQVFQGLLTFYDVKHLKACATSAMRDAQNSNEMIKIVEDKTGIKIQVISGDEEAVLVNENHIAENMDRDHGYLYVNVGGGSTDLIFYVNGKLRYKKSIDIGTIRILKNLVTETHWDNLKAELKANVKSNLPLVAIGSGGNINKIFSLSKKKEGKPLSLDLLKKYYEDFNNISVEERIHLYKFREDRADVIVPALQIYINLMRWADIKEIYVPKIGLVDGLAHALYQEIVNKF